MLKYQIPFVLIPGEYIPVLIINTLTHPSMRSFIQIFTSPVTFLDSVLDSNSAADPAAAPRQVSSSS